MSEEIKEEKIVTDNEEIKEFNKTVLGKLDNPLVVHKKSDASYDDNAPVFEMNETHTDEARPTLTRHRFKKEKKSKRGYIFVLVIIVILAAVFSGLYYTGNITFGEKETTSKVKQTTSETTTSLTDLYQGTIVVKDTYIFVNGIEVNGIEGLQDALEYEDKSTTAFTIIDENANSDYLNFEILPILQQLGFYDELTDITHKASTGLIAEAETTTLPPETTEKKTEKATEEE